MVTGEEPYRWRLLHQELRMSERFQLESPQQMLPPIVCTDAAQSLKPLNIPTRAAPTQMKRTEVPVQRATVEQVPVMVHP